MGETNIETLIKNIKEKHCNDSIDTLYKEYLSLCYKALARYNNALYKLGHPPGEINLKLIIYEAAKSFDFNRNVKFSSHLVNCIRYECLDLIRRNGRNLQKKVLILRDYETSKDNYDEELYKEIIMHLQNIDDERVRKVFEFRYFADNKKESSWKSIGQKLDVCAQTALNLHAKGCKIILDKIT